MEKTKLFKVASQLSAHELSRLRSFVKDAVKQISKPNRLLLHISESLKSKPSVVPTKELLWQSIYVGSPYDDRRFRKLCADALQRIEEFLSMEAYFADAFAESTFRLIAFQKRGMNLLHRSQLARALSLGEKEVTRDAPFFYHQYLIEQSQYQMSHASERFKVADIDRILQNLDKFYVTEKLRYHCEVLSRKTFIDHNYQNQLIGPILQMVNEGPLKDVAVIGIYYQIVLTHLHPDEEQHYFDLKERLQRDTKVISPAHLKEVFYSALNYCNRKINKGKKYFLREAFDMYREVLEKGLIYEKGHLSQWTFKNVLILSLRLGEYDWAEQALDVYGQKLHPKYRRNALTYNRAQLHFYRQDYPNVLSLLQTVEYDDVTYNLGAKTMLLATYYELGEYKALQNLGDSFKVFLLRKKQTISEQRRKSYLNLIRMTLRLANTPEHAHQAIRKINTELEQIGQLASENWIREKVKRKLLQSQKKIKNAR
ncbi:MAG: hypothetical protein HKN87_03200 [Saprospiraceae bacterium]|nr:hypothetical protein [Saprospiraceae bacterium]